MRKSTKYALIAAGSVLGLGLGWGLYVLSLAGQLSALPEGEAATCVRIEGVVGAEDLVRSRTGALLVSSDDRRATARGEPVRGSIRVVELAAGGGQPPRIYTADDGGDDETPALFHPHGLSLIATADGGERLFVVNHPRESLFGPNDTSEGPPHTIEIFDVRTGQGQAGRELSLVHQHTIADPMLISPNDLAAVDDTRFYVSNDHGSRSHFGAKLEDYAHLARSHVLYWDGQAFTRVADDIYSANGVALSPDGAQVYVASATGARVMVYDRDAASGALSLREEIETHGPDNISIAADGALWIGAHAKLLSFVSYSKDPTKLSPSMVTRLSPGASGWTQTHPFVTDGSDISGSSVALELEPGHFVVGSVFDAWLLDCTASSPGL